MPLFVFKSFSPSGTVVEGSMVASSEAEVEFHLQRRGLRLLAASVSNEGRAQWWRGMPTEGDGLSLTELLNFTGGFAALANAAIPLDEVLRLLGGQADSRRLKRVIERLHDGVNGGDTLADTMAKLPSAFSAEFVSVVRAGETSASLGEVMTDLLRLMERRHHMRSKLRSAMLYPCILIIAALAAMIVVVGYLIPTLSPVFRDAGVPLPGILSFTLGISQFIAGQWILCAVAVVATALGVTAAIRSSAFRRIASRQSIRMPIVGKYIVKRNLAAFSRTLGTLLKAGIVMPAAYASALAVVTNDTIAKRLLSARGDMLEGTSFVESLRRNAAMPAMALGLVAVGEKTGKLDPMLFHIAKLYEADCEKLLDDALTLLTPALTLAIGLMVGGLMTSIMTAIMSVNELALR